MSVKITYKPDDSGRVHLAKINPDKGHDFILEEASSIRGHVFLMYHYTRESDDFASGIDKGIEQMLIANDDIPDLICALVKYMEGLNK